MKQQHKDKARDIIKASGINRPPVEGLILSPEGFALRGLAILLSEAMGASAPEPEETPELEKIKSWTPPLSGLSTFADVAKSITPDSSPSNLTRIRKKLKLALQKEERSKGQEHSMHLADAYWLLLKLAAHRGKTKLENYLPKSKEYPL